MSSQTAYTTSDEWRRALSVAETVKLTARDLQLEPKREWLRQVMNEAVDQLRACVLWAASQGSPSDSTRETLRPLIVAADAARSNAALASYFLSFVGQDEMIQPASRDVASQLHAVELEMGELSRHMRTELGADPYMPA